MKSKTIIPLFGADMNEEYNRHLRRRLQLKALAWWLRGLAAAILLMGFGALIALVNSVAIAIPAAAIVLAGIWGQHYLTTRH